MSEHVGDAFSPAEENTDHVSHHKTSAAENSVTGETIPTVVSADGDKNTTGEITHDVVTSTDKNGAGQTGVRDNAVEVEMVRDNADEVEMVCAADEVFSEEIHEVYETEPVVEGDFRIGTILPVNPDVIEKLSNGFVQRFLPKLEKARLSLDEVLCNQQILIESVEQEKEKFEECTAMQDVTNTMIKAKKYYNKLISLKKEMILLHDKSTKLKKRAVKLQQQKQKDELQKAQQLEREHEKERMLNARIARRSDS